MTLRYDIMDKEVMISFQTTLAVSKALEAIAEEKQMSVSCLIDAILQKHLIENKRFEDHALDRRRTPRKTVSLSAYLGDSNWQRRDFQEIEILDLSINGVRFSLPKTASLQIINGKEIDKYIIIFRLPDYSWPLNVQITPQRIFETDKEVQIGASLINPDYCTYTAMQQYLA